MSLAIIGGTGLVNVAQVLESSETATIETPYGEGHVVKGVVKGKNIIVLPRHGVGHDTPPHKINYRANIWTLKELGVTHTFALAAVGSLRNEIAPGDFVLIDQFIDFTKGRASTFFETGDEDLKHIDMNEPYDPRLRVYLGQAIEQKEIRYHPSGTYICTEGPRFETPAEIKFFQQIGGDVVGMTGVPEVVLANEADISYATLAVASNYAAGITGNRLRHEECIEEMHRWDRVIFDIFVRAGEIGKLL
jgi:5'-methylthioadenosine phosphorylase